MGASFLNQTKVFEWKEVSWTKRFFNEIIEIIENQII